MTCYRKGSCGPFEMYSCNICPASKPEYLTSHHEGLKVKYQVRKVSNGELIDGCFVLRPNKDKAAVSALYAYAEATENMVLAHDIRKWLEDLEKEEEKEMNETIIRQYRKKPVIIEAVQLNNVNVPFVVHWIGEDKAKMNLESYAAWQQGKAPPMFSVTILTLEGDMKAMPGDYIIKGVNGEFYPCKPDIFEKTYEAVEQPKEKK